MARSPSPVVVLLWLVLSGHPLVRLSFSVRYQGVSQEAAVSIHRPEASRSSMLSASGSRSTMELADVPLEVGDNASRVLAPQQGFNERLCPENADKLARLCRDPGSLMEFSAEDANASGWDWLLDALSECCERATETNAEQGLRENRALQKQLEPAVAYHSQMMRHFAEEHDRATNDYHRIQASQRYNFHARMRGQWLPKFEEAQSKAEELAAEVQKQKGMYAKVESLVAFVRDWFWPLEPFVRSLTEPCFGQPYGEVSFLECLRDHFPAALVKAFSAFGSALSDQAKVAVSDAAQKLLCLRPSLCQRSSPAPSSFVESSSAVVLSSSDSSSLTGSSARASVVHLPAIPGPYKALQLAAGQVSSLGGALYTLLFHVVMFFIYFLRDALCFAVRLVFADNLLQPDWRGCGSGMDEFKRYGGFRPLGYY